MSATTHHVTFQHHHHHLHSQLFYHQPTKHTHNSKSNEITVCVQTFLIEFNNKISYNADHCTQLGVWCLWDAWHVWDSIRGQNLNSNIINTWKKRTSKDPSLWCSPPIMNWWKYTQNARKFLHIYKRDRETQNWKWCMMTPIMISLI